MAPRMVRDGRVAVLISTGYGAGWSTWNEEYPDMIWDVQVVDLLLQDLDFDQTFAKIKEICAIKYPDAYIGGLDGLRVEWVQQGEKFRVTEYDGSERIEYFSNMDWHQA
jgi:hypothetical protein